LIVHGGARDVWLDMIVIDENGVRGKLLEPFRYIREKGLLLRVLLPPIRWMRVFFSMNGERARERPTEAPTK
jgi:hypothetical protein